jgi:hypothetical protein
MMARAMLKTLSGVQETPVAKTQINSLCWFVLNKPTKGLGPMRSRWWKS